MRVALGMSGGVDSAVAAKLLSLQGHTIEAVTMTLGCKSCIGSSEQEVVKRSARLCKAMGIPHHVVDLSESWQSSVIGDFKAEYLRGRTPNPCVVCNRMVKFGSLMSACGSLFDFDFFATGHYARIEKEDGRFFVARGADRVKDQSYFLYQLSQAQLERTLFPLGGYTKSEIYELSSRYSLFTDKLPESQDFYAGDYTDLLGVGPEAGEIVDLAGKVLGHHRGYFHYTIGQRKGLGISSPVPLYVYALDAGANRVVVASAEACEQSEIVAADLVGYLKDGEYMLDAKVRSTGTPAPVKVSVENHLIRARMLSSVRGVAAGQSLVLYRNDRIVAGGVIEYAR